MWLKLQYFGHLMWRVDSLEKTLMLGGIGARRKGDDRGWDGWMASPTRWTWVWVNSGSWWWTGRPGVLQFMGSQRVGHDWATELNWTEWASYIAFPSWNFYWPYFPFARSLWLPSLLIILFLEAFCWNTSCRNRKRTLEINFLSTYKSEVLYFSHAWQFSMYRTLCF